MEPESLSRSQSSRVERAKPTRRLRRALGRSILIGGLLTGGAVFNDTIPHNPPIIQKDRSRILPTSPTLLKAESDIISSPDSQELTQLIESNYDNGYLYNDYIDYAAEQAKKYGLHLVENPYEQLLKVDLAKTPKEAFLLIHVP